ncbi:hypothetical protein [Pseudomonas abyssi]|uniref:hypothetical protein n=1 Tax=Pseudomonas abyssi TaxID=170540 RepID=UPI003C798B5B
MSKPEIVAYLKTATKGSYAGMSVACTGPTPQDMNDDLFVGEDLIRLTDHEAVIASYQSALDAEAKIKAGLREDVAFLTKQRDDLEAASAADKARLDSGCIMTNERDEFGHEYQCQRRGLNLRERIDAALAQQGKEAEC